MAKKPKDFEQQMAALCRRLGIDPADTNSFSRVAMKLIHQQPEFRDVGRPKDSVARSKIDEAAVVFAESLWHSPDVRKKPGVTFDTALRAVVAWLEQGGALAQGARDTNLKRLRRLKKVMDADRKRQALADSLDNWTPPPDVKVPPPGTVPH
jgi:hypothetical protein